MTMTICHPFFLSCRCKAEFICFVAFQDRIDIGVFPDRRDVGVFTETDILVEMCLAPEANAFQQLPRGGILRIAFGIDPMCAFLKSASEDRGKGFGSVTLSLIVFVYDIADFFRGKIPGPAINAADHLPGIGQHDGIEGLAAQTLPQMPLPFS